MYEKNQLKIEMTLPERIPRIPSVSVHMSTSMIKSEEIWCTVLYSNHSSPSPGFWTRSWKKRRDSYIMGVQLVWNQAPWQYTGSSDMVDRCDTLSSSDIFVPQLSVWNCMNWHLVSFHYLPYVHTYVYIFFGLCASHWIKVTKPLTDLNGFYHRTFL